MRIFKILFFSVLSLFANQDSLYIKSIDSLTIIKNFDKILKNDSNLFISYQLSSFNLQDKEVVYVKKKHNKTVDTILVYDESIINMKITNRILNPYLHSHIGDQYYQIGDEIVKKYYFITEIPKYNFGIIGSGKLGAMFSLNPKFNSLFTSLVGINNENGLKINGEINMHSENFLKNAEIFDIYWKKTDSISQIMKFGVFIPHPFSFDLGFDWKYHYEIFNAFYIKNENRVMLQTFIPLLSNVKIGFVKGQTNITDKGRKNDYEALSYNAFSIAIYNDKRNDRLLPYIGSLVNLIFDGGLDRDKFYFNSSTKMISYYNLSKNVSLRFQWIMQGLYYHNHIIPKSRYLFFGGGTTLRGYQEQTFKSTQYQVHTLELIYNQMSNFQTNLFIDLGTVNLNPLSEYIFGVGIGMTQINDNYIIKLEYALSNSNFKDGKIHLKWISRF